jgi:predicted outer membrane repeat protein
LFSTFFSGSGGVLYLEKSSNAELHDVLMIANEAAMDGGAIYSEGTSFDMSNVQFTMNKAKAGTAKGGAMYVAGDSEIDMDNCQFVSSSSGSDGGAVYAGGSTTIDYDDW